MKVITTFEDWLAYVQDARGRLRDRAQINADAAMKAAAGDLVAESRARALAAAAAISRQDWPTESEARTAVLAGQEPITPPPDAPSPEIIALHHPHQQHPCGAIVAVRDGTCWHCGGDIEQPEWQPVDPYPEPIDEEEGGRA